MENKIGHMVNITDKGIFKVEGYSDDIEHKVMICGDVHDYHAAVVVHSNGDVKDDRWKYGVSDSVKVKNDNDEKGVIGRVGEFRGKVYMIGDGRDRDKDIEDSITNNVGYACIIELCDTAIGVDIKTDSQALLVLEDIVPLVGSAKNMSCHKQLADQLQIISDEMIVALMIAAKAGVLVPCLKASNESMAFIDTWCPLFQLLFTSREFRDLCVDFIYIIRQVLLCRKFIEVVGDMLKITNKILVSGSIINHWMIVGDGRERGKGRMRC